MDTSFVIKRPPSANWVGSHEGFLDKLKDRLLKKGEDKKADTDEPAPLAEWELLQKLPKYGPRDFERVSERPYQAGKRIAAFFVRQGAVLDDPVSALKEELSFYRATLRGMLNQLSPVIRYMHDTQRRLDKFSGDVDRADEFLKELKVCIDAMPPSMKGKFRDPGRDLLGYGRGRLLEEGWRPNPHEVVTVRALDPKEARVLRDLIVDSYELESTIEDKLPLGFDLTDPPFRGYIEEASSLLVDWRAGMDVFEEEYTGPINRVLEKLAELRTAYLRYLTSVIENN